LGGVFALAGLTVVASRRPKKPSVAAQFRKTPIDKIWLWKIFEKKMEKY
jgi:hypothetical protein